MVTTVEFPADLTPRAVRILEAAADEASAAGATAYIGVEHVFLAILRDPESVPAQVVARLGFRDAILREVERIVGSEA